MQDAKLPVRRTLWPLALVCLLTAGSGARVSSQEVESWRGVLVQDGSEGTDGNEVEFRISSRGFPLYQYSTKTDGDREVEITHVGQVVQYVPPGGGVKTVEATELEVLEQRISMTLEAMYEGTSGGVLEQTRSRTVTVLERRADQLLVTITVTTSSVVSDPDLSVGGEPITTTYRGVFRRQR